MPQACYHGKNTARSAEGGTACTEHSPRRRRAFFAALCPQRRGHARRLAGAAAARFLRRQPHKSAPETHRLPVGRAAQYARRGFGRRAAARHADGARMSAGGAVPAADAAGLPEPGYALGRRYWGQDYATEALAAVVRYLFESEGQAAPACCHSHENPASGCAMQKCGFCPVRGGVYHKYGGTAAPRRHYLLTKEEFQTQL